MTPDSVAMLIDALLHYRDGVATKPDTLANQSLFDSATVILDDLAAQVELDALAEAWRTHEPD